MAKLWCFSDFLLPQDVEYVPDLLVISSQEAYNDRTEWEIRLQDTLGPSHVLYTVNNKESSPHENLNPPALDALDISLNWNFCIFPFCVPQQFLAAICTKCPY